MNVIFDVLLSLFTSRRLNLKVVTCNALQRMTFKKNIFPICFIDCEEPPSKLTGESKLYVLGLVNNSKWAHMWLEATVSIIQVSLGKE